MLDNEIEQKQIKAACRLAENAKNINTLISYKTPGGVKSKIIFFENLSNNNNNNNSRTKIPTLPILKQTPTEPLKKEKISFLNMSKQLLVSYKNKNLNHNTKNNPSPSSLPNHNI